MNIKMSCSFGHVLLIVSMKYPIRRLSPDLWPNPIFRRIFESWKVYKSEASLYILNLELWNLNPQCIVGLFFYSKDPESDERSHLLQKRVHKISLPHCSWWNLKVKNNSRRKTLDWPMCFNHHFDELHFSDYMNFWIDILACLNLILWL